jgi:hypothetical protein
MTLISGWFDPAHESMPLARATGHQHIDREVTEATPPRLMAAFAIQQLGVWQFTQR